MAGTVRHAPKRNCGAARLASAACGVRALRRCNQLQKLLGIIQPLLELWSQGLRRDLGCHADITGQRIGRHKLHFIDLDRALFCSAVECFLDLLGHILGFGASYGKGAYQAGKVFDGHIFGKVQAGQAGRTQELPKAAFGLSGFQRNSIQQQFVVGNPQEEAALSSRRQAMLQFVPGGLELRFRSFVIRAVHARIFDQNVQAVHKSARGGRPIRIKCGRVVDKTPSTRSSGYRQIKVKSNG